MRSPQRNHQVKTMVDDGATFSASKLEFVALEGQDTKCSDADSDAPKLAVSKKNKKSCDDLFALGLISEEGVGMNETPLGILHELPNSHRTPVEESPLPVTFTENENPFRTPTGTNFEKNDSPTGVMDLDNACFQPRLVAPWTAAQEKAVLEQEMTLQPVTLHSSGMLDPRTGMPQQQLQASSQEVLDQAIKMMEIEQTDDKELTRDDARDLSWPTELANEEVELDSSCLVESQAEADTTENEAVTTSVDHKETSHTSSQDTPVITNGPSADANEDKNADISTDSILNLTADGESHVDAFTGAVEVTAEDGVLAADQPTTEQETCAQDLEEAATDSPLDTSNLTASGKSAGGNSIQVSISSTSTKATSNQECRAAEIESPYSWNSFKSTLLSGFQSSGVFEAGLPALCNSPDAASKDGTDKTIPAEETPAQATVTKDSLAFHSEEGKSSKVVLYIDHYGPQTFFRLMKDLKYNELITELHIFRSWNEDISRSRNKADICILFDAIRTLPRLDKLELSNFLPAELDGVKGSQWQNPLVKSVRIHLCKGSFSKNLLKNVASIPSLVDLTLEINESFPFHHVLDSKSLRSLSIVGSDVVLEHAHIMELVYVLRKNDTLQKLSMESPIGAKSFKFIAYGLSSNTGLEDLRVNIMPGSFLQANEAIQEFATALKSNTTLKSVWNTSHAELRIMASVGKNLLNAMAINNTLQEMMLFDEEPAFHCAKEALLRENRTSSAPILTDFYFPGCGTFESIRELAITVDNPDDNMSVVDSVVTDYAVIGSSIYRFADSLKDFGKTLLGIAVDATCIMQQEKCGSMEDAADVSMAVSSVNDVAADVSMAVSMSSVNDLALN